MKIDRAIEEVQRAEDTVADELRALGERYAVEADVYHVSRTLAARCELQLERLRPHAERYDATERLQTDESPPVVERLRRLTSHVLGSHPPAGQLLLDDLRGLYLTMHEAELAWAILVQAAKSARDAELLAAAEKGREEAERRWKWVRTRVKETAPQVLVAG